MSIQNPICGTCSANLSIEDHTKGCEWYEQDCLLVPVEKQSLDVVLYCPKCDTQHIDKAEPDKCESCGHEHKFHFNAGERNICAVGKQITNDKIDCHCNGFTAWLNPKHKSHRCHSCNYVWKPFDFPTNGVLETSEQPLENAPADVHFSSADSNTAVSK